MSDRRAIRQRSSAKPRRIIPEWVLHHTLEAVRSYCRAVLGALLPPPANVRIVSAAILKMADDEWIAARSEVFELPIAVVAADLDLPYETTRRFARRKILWGCTRIDARYLVRNARLDRTLSQDQHTPALVLMAAAVRFHDAASNYITTIEQQAIGPDEEVRHMLHDIRAIIDHALSNANSAPVYTSLEAVAARQRWSLKRTYALARTRRLPGCTKVGAIWKHPNPELLTEALLQTALSARAAGVTGK
jgi:hypothetical protein